MATHASGKNAFKQSMHAEVIQVKGEETIQYASKCVLRVLLS